MTAADPTPGVVAALGELGRIIRWARLDRGRLAAAIGLGVLTVIAGVGLLALSGYLISRAAQQPPILSLTVIMVAVRALALVKPGARYGDRLVSHDLAFRTLGRLRAKVFATIEPLAPAGLEAFRDGELLSRLVADVDALQDLVLRIVVPVAVAGLASVVIVAGVAVVSPTVAAALAVGLLLGAVLPAAVAYRVTARSTGRQAAWRATLTADLVEALEAAPELWLLEADGAAADRVAEHDRRLVEVAARDAAGAGWANALGVLVAGLTMVGVAVLATRAAGAGSIDPLAVAPLVLVALGAFEAVLPLAGAARHLPTVVASGQRLLELDGRPAPIVDPATPLEAPAPRPAIDVDGLVVTRGRQGDEVTVLAGVDLDLAAGERIVVEGPSGVGKTTLLHVLVRFLAPTAGRVDLDDHDLGQYRQEDVRHEVLLLGQDAHVFNSDLRENVAFARPGSTDDEIVDALGRAQLGPWLAELPDGLDTMVGEHGRTLSGGQRQRLSMARAFLADPSILLLDEPTAHLDAATAAALLDDLWERIGDRSAILVTHGDPGAFASSRHLAMAAPVPGSSPP